MLVAIDMELMILDINILTSIVGCSIDRVTGMEATPL